MWPPLRTADYLCGEFSVADIGTFIMLNAASGLGFPPDKELRALGRWSERTLARPAVRSEVVAMSEYLVGALGAAAS